ncbi:hypothetical protein BU26DRAFT_506745 [Trematosphaeria pertusa]|uniref:SH3 domain-containing protein n=1 Tax=Trematosphaeria pertusa TaxID=390896 RepID=A0A6A6IBS5_9PLEO|nr:uncharacterized protein BU26DRAFT_506745 [Trematosphaeria pertusa]KAF2247518.1 hypothetical protein BU26DRAFT_506745 [Trematosphaeria pertusa]
MAADVLSPRSEPGSLTSPSANRTSLPPLVTSPPSNAKLQRASSYASKRLSTFSNASNPQSIRSRPQSTAFPIFHSSLPYTLVRDFAYGPLHPLFYGPLPEQPSDISTPASEVSRRLSDPPAVPWHPDRGGWSAGPWEPGEQLPPTSYGDGPPWSEDDDISSPVVTSHTRHKKHKSNIVDFDQTRGRKAYLEEPRRGSYSGTNGDGSQVYYVSEMNEDANGPGGEYITYPPEPSSSLEVPTGSSRRDSHFATTLPQRAYADADGPPYDSDEEMSEPDDFLNDESRFSRDYQFTIASPEEEMHGKAVALFDFERENDNELPLVEGQIILISYRHGQGWLVAQDPKSGESGLVPEEYVRLLRDIEGGWNGLMNGTAVQQELNNPEGLLSPVSAGPEAKTPTQADHKPYTPVISTFSTSTKDLEPYPKEMLGTPTAPDGAFPRPRDGSKERADAAEKSEGAPMEGVEASPEPTSRPQSQDARS